MIDKTLSQESPMRVDLHVHTSDWSDGKDSAATMIEIGIALSTVAIITSRRAFWFSAVGLGCVGAALFAFAYLAI